MAHFHSTIQNKVSELGPLAEAITRFLRQEGVPDAPSYAIHLAVEELVINVVRHAHSDNDEHAITVVLDHNEPLVTLTIEDDGNPFDPTQHPAPDLKLPLQDMQPGGLGIHLVKELARSLHYERVADRNRVTVEVETNAKAKK